MLKFLDPTGATYYDGKRFAYNLPRSGERWARTDHPSPATQDGLTCGHGRLHLMNIVSACYAPNNFWPWHAKGIGLCIGSDTEKSSYASVNLRVITPTMWHRFLRRFGHGANLNWVNLREANLRGADLRGANLNMASLHMADLGGANLNKASLRMADLGGANLSKSNLREANLRGADLRDADLNMADIAGANLRGANLSWADLCGADLRDADLSGANLDRAIINGNTAGIDYNTHNITVMSS